MRFGLGPNPSSPRTRWDRTPRYRWPGAPVLGPWGPHLVEAFNQGRAIRLGDHVFQDAGGQPFLAAVAGVHEGGKPAAIGEAVLAAILGRQDGAAAAVETTVPG